MKKKLLPQLSIVILMVLLTNFKLHSQTMNVILTSGTTQNYTITDISKIYFSNSNLVFNNASSYTPIEQIRKITFTTQTGVNTVTADENTLKINPNPVTDYITFKNAPDENCIVNIYSVTGAKIVSTQKNPSVNILNVHTLSKGIYFVKIKNFTTKFIKL